MANRESAYIFTRDEIVRFEAELRPIDATLELLAKKYGLRSFKAADKGWPGRTLRGRRWLKTYLLRVSLDPAYTRTGVMRWEIHDLWMFDFGEAFRKLLTFRVLLKGLDSMALASGTAAAVVEDAVTENLPRVD